MKYGFVIDNRKCIGCHACTTACKAEHEVPVGVNRTWVKQVEKGSFPDTRRLFSVMRCNHCTNAPCVSICPTNALNYRDDGIVDFDADRCIGCKSCMQACPYDALYIDPETKTAAKCNYCANRVDVGLEPACVNVCPEHAIISGDMDNPNSEIAQLLAQQATKVRKPEKGTNPNLFYIDADDVSLVPTATNTSDVSLWGSQSMGVGHFAKEAEKMSLQNGDVLAETIRLNSSYEMEQANEFRPKGIEAVLDKAKQVYNSPQKGILWAWEVSTYVWTKAISAGCILVPAIALLCGLDEVQYLNQYGILLAILFLAITGVLLIKDLDQPKRFAYVLLRPQWKSWLVKGAYAITLYGLLLGLLLLLPKVLSTENSGLLKTLFFITAVAGAVVAIYTAFLFAQAKGRDFWQSPTLAVHMFVHSVMAGLAVYFFLAVIMGFNEQWFTFLRNASIVCIAVNMLTVLFELGMTHSTEDAKLVAHMILKGRYRSMFWLGVVLIGNVLPLALLAVLGPTTLVGALSGALILLGIYVMNHIWVEAPQRIALS